MADDVATMALGDALRQVEAPNRHRLVHSPNRMYSHHEPCLVEVQWPFLSPPPIAGHAYLIQCGYEWRRLSVWAVAGQGSR